MQWHLMCADSAAAASLCFVQRLPAILMLQDYVLGDRADTIGVLVRAGLHEVDLFKRRMTSCYCPGTIHRAIRGTWFVDKGSGYAPLKVTDLSLKKRKVYTGRRGLWEALGRPMASRLTVFTHATTASSRRQKLSYNCIRLPNTIYQ